MANELNKSSHILLFPFPLQGHVNSMLNLAELFAVAGIHVTFLITQHIQNRLFRRSVDHRSTRLRFTSIPDGLEDDNTLIASKLIELVDSMRTRAVIPYKDLLFNLTTRLDDSSDDEGWPLLSCVIVDGLIPFAAEVAEEMGVPAIIFRTISACCTWTYFCIPLLLQSRELPFKKGEDLDELLTSVPGMESFLRRRDLSLFCRNAKDSSDPHMKLMSEVTEAARRGRALVLNTFEALEASTLSYIRTKCPKTFAIGPIHAHLRSYSRDTEKVDSGHVGRSGNLLDVDWSCIDWLDSQPDRSVIYVSFGSLTVMSVQDFVEFWIGLVNSNHRFLWVVRSNLIEELECSNVVDSLKEATEERGQLIEWAPQEEVLAHRAVGCFFTHSGWNSTLESVVAGVPMLCWPFFADQQMNSRFVGEVWGIGLDMKDLRGREVVERMVREMMEGEELRNSAAEMSELARRSVEKGGSSRVQFEQLLGFIKSFTA